MRLSLAECARRELRPPFGAFRLMSPQFDLGSNLAVSVDDIAHFQGGNFSDAHPGIENNAHTKRDTS
jgi:hypothetical protein